MNPDKKNDPLSQAIDGIYHYRKMLDTIAPNLSDRFPIEIVQRGDVMTHEKMQEMLSKDEKITIEYKEYVNQIHDSVYETVAAFSN